MKNKSGFFTTAFYLWLLLMLVVSSIPDSRISAEKILGWDKLAHWSEYLILTSLYYLMRIHSRKSIIVLHFLLLALALPIADELHQLLIPGRSCSYLDALADLCGAFSAFLMFALVNRFRRIRL